MPLPLVPLIAAGATLAGQAINAGSTANANRQARDFAREQYDKQRKDSLADWNMQNSYNSPQAQMQRLADAGLNPNLVYGTGAVGNSSGQVHEATPQTWRPQAPQFDGGSIMQQYFNTAMQSATLDNVKATNDKIKAETENIVAQSGLRQRDLNDFNRYLINSRIISNRADISDIDRMKNEQTFRSVVESTNFLNEQKMVQAGIDTKIKNLISQGKSIDNVLKQLEVDLQKNGLSSKDPAVMRILGRFISNYFDMSNFKFK